MAVDEKIRFAIMKANKQGGIYMSFDLSAVPTCELVDEFKKREGVWATRSSLMKNIQLPSVKRYSRIADRL